MAKVTIMASVNAAKNITIKKELVKLLPLASLTLNRELESLFPIKESLLKEIMSDMSLNGFDQSQPIHLYGDDHILIDGHTRRLAAEKIGLSAVYVYQHDDITTLEDAKKLSIKLQFNRRNLSKEERDAIIIQYHQFFGGEQRGKASVYYGQGGVAKQIAQAIGSSERTVNRTIAQHKETTAPKRVEHDEVSILQQSLKKQINSITTMTNLKAIEHCITTLTDG